MTTKQVRINSLLSTDQIKTGDLLIISDGETVINATAKIVQVTDRDGTEIIFNKKKNKYFNVGMYLAGKSWAKSVFVVTI